MAFESVRPTPERTIRFQGILSEPRLDHPESVAVAPDGSLWCGGEAGQIFRIHGDTIEVVANTGGFILGVSFDTEGNLFACDIGRTEVWRLDPRTRALEPLSASLSGHQLITPNFALPLPDGSLLVSDSGVAHQPRTGMVRFAHGTGSIWLEEPLNFANGLALSPDGTTVYIAESWSNRILAVDVDASYRPRSSAYVYCDLPGYIPDGLAVDSDGSLYVGCYEPSAVLRVSTSRKVEILAQDPTAHELCHPTGVVVSGRELLVANLGRWHITSISLGTTHRSQGGTPGESVLDMPSHDESTSESCSG